MPKKRTWIWILVTGAAICIVALLAMATAGVIFVSNHIQAQASTSVERAAAVRRGQGTLQGSTAALRARPA